LGVPVQQATAAERRKKRRFIKFLIPYIPEANRFLLQFKGIQLRLLWFQHYHAIPRGTRYPVNLMTAPIRVIPLLVITSNRAGKWLTAEGVTMETSYGVIRIEADALEARRLRPKDRRRS
jgi:hypothetical protein